MIAAAVTGGWHGSASDLTCLPRLQIPVRPAHFETALWYLRRLCIANGVDSVWLGGIVRARRQARADPSEMGRAIAELGGPEPEHWSESHARARHGLSGVRSSNGPYGRQGMTRLTCLSCTGGETVATYDHIRFGFCTKHGRWVGPGTTSTTQRGGLMDAEQHRAERAARGLVNRGLVDADLFETAWHLTRDWAYLTGKWPERLRQAAEPDTFTREVDDRIALYPETVRLLRLVASPQFQTLAEIERGGATDRRAYLHAALDWLPVEQWVVAEGIEEWVEDRRRRRTTDPIAHSKLVA